MPVGQNLVDAALDNNTFIVLIYLLAGRLLHEVAHGVMVYIAMRPEVRPMRFNPLAYTSWAYTWAWPIVGLAVLTMPLPGAMVKVKAEDLRGRGWQSLVALAGPIVTFGLLGFVAVRWGYVRPIPQGIADWFWIELVAACLNLLPLPGLDGYGILESWLPGSWQEKWRERKWLGPIVLLIGLCPEGVRAALRIQPGEIYLEPNWLAVLGVAIASLVIAQRERRRNPPVITEGGDPRSKTVMLQDLARIEGLVAANPRQVAAGLWLEQGRILERLERWDEAIAVYEQGVIYHPQNVMLWQRQGRLRTKQGRYEAALSCYIKASDQVGGDTMETWHLQADVLLELERWEMAISVFDKVLQVMPEDGHILADRGYACFKLGQFEAAVESLAKAVELEPDDYNYYWYAKSLQEVGELEKALAMAKRAMHKRGDALTTDFVLTLQQQLRDYEGAIQTCETALQNYLQLRDWGWIRAMLHLQMGQPEKALVLIEELQSNRLRPEQLLVRCRLHYQAKDYEAALADCLLSLKWEPEQPIGLELYGQILEEMGKGRQAIGIYRKLLTLRPELFWVRVRLGVLLLERQQYGSALEMFTIVLEARPEDVDVLYLQGFTLTELGRMDEARTVVEKLLAIAPEHELGQRLSEALENRN